MYRFLITASILVLLGFIYLGSRLIVSSWAFPLRAALWITLGLMIANLLWLPFKRWTRPQKTGPFTRYLEASAYNLMGFLSLLLLFTSVTEFLRVILRTLPENTHADLVRKLPQGMGLDSAFSFIVMGFALFFFLWGRTAVFLGPRYRFVKIAYPLAGRPRRRPRFKRKALGERKIRVAQVSDLHIGRAIKKDYVQRVVDMINEQNVDFACFTGDIGDGHVPSLVADAAPLANLRTTHGSYYIPGNHEYYWGMQTWLAAFKAIGLKPVINRGEILSVNGEKIFLAGVSDPTAARFAEDLPKIPERADADVAILLAHQPNFARSAHKMDYDLMLSGHTHGGQYIPWSWVAHLVFRYASGLYRLGKTLIYVNEGTGYWGAPLRIGTRLEITILDIHLAAGEKHAG